MDAVFAYATTSTEGSPTVSLLLMYWIPTALPAPNVFRPVFISWVSNICGLSKAIRVHISIGFGVVDAVLFWRHKGIVEPRRFGAGGSRLPKHKKESGQDRHNRPH